MIAGIFVYTTLCCRYLFKSGNADHPDDRFYNATVEVLPLTPPSDTNRLKYPVSSKEQNFIIINKFDAAVGKLLTKHLVLKVQ